MDATKTRRSITISYTAPQPFLSSSTWSQIHSTLLSHLPLRNLHWKSPSRSSIVTIQELDVSLVHLDTVRDEHTSQVPMTLLEKPLLNIYIVSCDNTDLEGYRSIVKKQIKDWHSMVTSRKNQEWLILHVVRPDAKAPSGNFFQLKGSVLDKIRADFNSEKRERCVQLLLTIDNPAVWGEVINKIKDGVLLAFQSSVNQREEEVKRSEGQRQMPGWNFCTFFILKESLARSFGGVKLHDEALVQYDELEDTFHQVLKEKNLSWFGTFITPDPKDDSAPLLSVSKKPYRDLILANTISVFDLRLYLLARQCELFANSGRILEVCTKVGGFLGAFGRRLYEVEVTLPPFFVESWIYSSALSVVEQCDLWVAELGLDPSISLYNAGKAELIQLARNQLDAIGIEVGHLPRNPPFSSALASHGKYGSSAGQISNAQLLATLKDKETFYDLYILITTRAIDLYAKAGRRKFALKLHGSIAALDIHRGRLDAALNTYTSLPAHYALHLWTSLESSALYLALETHASLDRPRDREWIHILLSFMKAYAESAGAELLISAKDQVTYISHLLEQLIIAASELQEDLHHPDHPAFSVEVTPSAELAGSKDGSYLEATVLNLLPCPLSATDLHVTLIGQESEQLVYSSGPCSLSAGKSRLRLFCPTPSSGTFIVDSSEIRLGSLLLQWSHRKSSSSSRGSRFSRPMLVKIPRDTQAFNLDICPPLEVQLDGTPRLSMKICSGRNKVIRASFRLSSSAVKFHMYDARLVSGEQAIALEKSSDHLAFQNMQDSQHIELLLPHSHASGIQAIKITAEAEYVTEAEPGITRSLKIYSTVSITLPISVNVEDFFRGKRLFSKFTVTTTNHQHVRIADAQLEIPPGLETDVEVIDCASRRPVYTVKTSQPVDYIFQINSPDGPVKEPLSLCIKYRTLREEVEAVISTVVDKIAPSLVSERETVVESLLKSLELNSSWVKLYEITGELALPSHDEGLEHLIDLVKHIKEALLAHRHSSAPEGFWRTVRIPVDVPHKNIVAAVSLKIYPDLLTNSKPIYAGQPIPATINIHTSFHWGSSHGDQQRQYVMQYDVEEMVREWLISGRKRGNFVAMDNATFTIPITLVALHHGEFALPQVAISALPLTDEITMGSLAMPSTETHQIHGAETIVILPRGGRSTLLVLANPPYGLLSCNNSLHVLNELVGLLLRDRVVKRDPYAYRNRYSQDEFVERLGCLTSNRTNIYIYEQ
ncbi:hypothetical protein E1B28_008737 [Marasmius oreades]|uniref:Trafficking protein particle complex subunit 10 n=1 Tax=Marasmius oreades TaxID=181124 RepID=A0A9P7RZP3_9AGAR|nr:uncharacterized protein E1B28_008737 [Marasmius oreades]KAG7092380.1 hypothetical protein E1B28_008737 [Marasmius oreades]